MTLYREGLKPNAITPCQEQLDGKVAIVSGSGRGIGREIALKLASEGARVVVNDLDAGPAEQTVADDRGRRRRGRGLRRAASPTAGFADRFVQHRGRHLRRPGHHRQQRRLHLGQRHPEDDRRAVGRHARRAPDGAVPHPARGAAGFIREAGQGARPRPAARCSARWSTSPRSPASYGNAGQANYAAAKAGIIGLTKAHGQGMGPLQGQRQQRRLRPDQDPADRGRRRRRRQHRHRGPADQGRRQPADAEERRGA